MAMNEIRQKHSRRFIIYVISIIAIPSIIYGLIQFGFNLPDFFFTSAAWVFICWTPIAIYDAFKWIRGK